MIVLIFEYILLELESPKIRPMISVQNGKLKFGKESNFKEKIEIEIGR